MKRAIGLTSLLLPLALIAAAICPMSVNYPIHDGGSRITLALVWWTG
jgi:hypothetical protein